MTVRLWRGLAIWFGVGLAAASLPARAGDPSPVATMKGHSGPVFALAFSPDGTLLATSSEDRTVRLWDYVTGQALREFKGQKHGFRSIAFSPDGTYLAGAEAVDGAVRVWEVKSGRLAVSLDALKLYGKSVAFTSDSRSLRISGSPNISGKPPVVTTADLPSGTRRAEAKPDTTGVDELIPIAGKDLLIGVRANGDVSLIGDRAPTRAVISFGTAAEPAEHHAWTDAADKVAAARPDGTILLWDAQRDGPAQPIAQAGDAVASLSLAPGGETVAAVTVDGRVSVWTTAKGRKVGHLPGGSVPATAVGLSPLPGFMVVAGKDYIVRSYMLDATAVFAVDDSAGQPIPAAEPPAAPETVPAPAPAASAPPASEVPRPSAAPRTEKRVALVIGNGGYGAVAQLTNPPRDARLIAETLTTLGFSSVATVNDTSRTALIAALREFEAKAAGADWGVIYYAGHGIEMAGQNYLVPVDAQLKSDRDVEDEAVPLTRVLAALDPVRSLKLVVLDACRDNPFAARMKRSVASRAIGRGLARVEPEGGTLVAYAAKGGETAADGDGLNSPFAAALATRMKQPGLEINKVFRLVRDDVLAATGRAQEPFVYGSIGGDDFFFNPKQ